MPAARLESPTIRTAAILLGVVAVICVLMIGLLSWHNAPPPEALAALTGFGGVALGALGTLLTTFTPSPLPGGRRVTDEEAEHRRLFSASMTAPEVPAPTEVAAP